MAKSDIILYINIEKTFDLDSFIEKIKSIKEYIKPLIDLNIDIRIEMGRNNISDQITFQMKSVIKNIITITSLRVPKKYRNRNYATVLLQAIVDKVGLDTIIFANVGISSLEYPPSKYTLNSEPGKIVLPVADILSKQVLFWSNRNYINMSDIFSHSKYSMIFMYHNPLGMMLHQAILDIYNTMSHPSNNMIHSFYYYIAKLYTDIISKDNNIYLLNDLYQMKEYNNISPRVLSDDKLLKAIDEGENLWYSKYSGEINVDKDIYAILVNNRKILTKIAGCEVYVRNENELVINLQKAMLIDNSDRFIDNSDSVISYEITGEDCYLEMVGYALFGDGVWLFGDWKLTKTNKILYDSESFNHEINDKPLLLVGLINDMVKK